jgi:hypothetical protein
LAANETDDQHETYRATRHASDALRQPPRFVAAGKIGRARVVTCHPLFQEAGNDQERERDDAEHPEEKRYLAGRCSRSGRCRGEMNCSELIGARGGKYGCTPGCNAWCKDVGNEKTQP